MAIGNQVISGDKLIAFGRELQGLGYKVSEHPSFGGVHATAHDKNSWHYDGLAIDVNYDNAGAVKEKEMLNKAVALAKARGITGIIWWSYGHYNHAHFDVSGWQRIGSNTGSIVNAGGVPPDPSTTNSLNPFAPITALIDFFTAPRLWLRIGYVVMGILLILVAFFNISKVTNAATQIVKKGINNVPTKP